MWTNKETEKDDDMTVHRVKCLGKKEALIIYRNAIHAQWPQLHSNPELCAFALTLGDEKLKLRELMQQNKGHFQTLLPGLSNSIVYPAKRV